MISCEEQISKPNITDSGWKEAPWEGVISDFRTCKRLELVGVKTLGEIAEKPDSFWLGIKGFGKGSLSILKNALPPNLDVTQLQPPVPRPHEPWMDLPWGLFVSDTRLVNVLTSCGIKTMGELSNTPDRVIMGWKNLGTKTLQVLRDAEARAKNLNEVNTKSLFHKHNEVDAWQKCLELSLVSKAEAKALISTETLEGIAKSFNPPLTKERARQLKSAAIAKLRRNPVIFDQIKEFYDKNTQKWAEIYCEGLRQNIKRPILKWASATIYVVHGSIPAWREEMKINVIGGYTELTPEKCNAINALLADGRVTTVNDLAAETGADPEAIAGKFNATKGYVRKTKISSYQVTSLRITDPFRTRILVTKKEIIEKTGVSHHTVDNIAHQSEFVWSAGPWVVIPPRDYKAEPMHKKPLIQDLGGCAYSKKAIEVLKTQLVWRMTDAVQAVKKECGAHVTYWMCHLPQVVRVSPGKVCVKENITPASLKKIRKSVLGLRDVGYYITAKESGSRLADFEIWDYTMEYEWAKWLKVQPNDPKHTDMKARFGKIAKPQHWGISKPEQQTWKKYFSGFTQDMSSLQNEQKMLKPDSHNLAIVAAILLKTGGVSITDINLLTGFALPSQNYYTDFIDLLTEMGWVEYRPGIEWRPKLVEDSVLLETLYRYSAERQKTHNPNKNRYSSQEAAPATKQVEKTKAPNKRLLINQFVCIRFDPKKGLTEAIATALAFYPMQKGLSIHELSAICRISTRQINGWYEWIGKSVEGISRKGDQFKYDPAYNLHNEAKLKVAAKLNKEKEIKLEMRTPVKLKRGPGKPRNTEADKPIPPRRTSDSEIPQWEEENREFKMAVRKIILSEALCATRPIKMLSLCGGQLMTERLMFENEVSFERILGVEQNAIQMQMCKSTLRRMPKKFKKIMELKKEDIVNLLRPHVSKESFSDYWLDFMGPMRSTTLESFSYIAQNPAAIRTIRDHGQIRIYATLLASDRWGKMDEGTKHHLTISYDRWKELAPDVPKVKTPERQETLNHYYWQAAALHLHNAMVFQCYGMQITNTHTVYYNDGGKSMVFFAFDVAFATGDPFKPKAPAEPVFLGIQDFTELPHNKAWIQDMQECGILEELTAQERELDENRKKAAAILQQRGFSKLAEIAKPKPRELNAKNDPEGWKYGPLAYQTLKILAQRPKISRDALSRELRRILPNGEMLATTKLSHRGTTTKLDNAISWAKAYFTSGGYTHPGNKNQIILSRKGQRLAKKLPAFTPEFGPMLKKGKL
jgi:hypothetical protein